MTHVLEFEFKTGWPKILRYSNVLASLRAMGEREDATAYDRADAAKAIATLEALYKQLGHTCSVHGHLDDPIVISAIVGESDQVAFVCPHCSDPRLLKQWEAEQLVIDQKTGAIIKVER